MAAAAAAAAVRSGQARPGRVTYIIVPDPSPSLPSANHASLAHWRDPPFSLFCSLTPPPLILRLYFPVSAKTEQRERKREKKAWIYARVDICVVW